MAEGNITRAVEYSDGMLGRIIKRTHTFQYESTPAMREQAAIVVDSTLALHAKWKAREPYAEVKGRNQDALNALGRLISQIPGIPTNRQDATMAVFAMETNSAAQAKGVLSEYNQKGDELFGHLIID